MLSNRFVKDLQKVVKLGQIVRVKVLDVDLKRQRIALTMRLDDVPSVVCCEAGGCKRGSCPPHSGQA